MGRTHAVKLLFAHSDELVKGLASVEVPTCWEHRKKSNWRTSWLFTSWLFNCVVGCGLRAVDSGSSPHPRGLLFVYRYVHSSEWPLKFGFWLNF